MVVSKSVLRVAFLEGFRYGISESGGSGIPGDNLFLEGTPKLSVLVCEILLINDETSQRKPWVRTLSGQYRKLLFSVGRVLIH